MFYDFALEHAWLIPLLPAMAFVIIGMITRSYGKLSAAIAVCMSFIKNEKQSVIESGPFVLNLKSRTVTKDGTPIELTQVEYQILEYFMNNKNTALDRASILNHIWGESYYGDDKIVDVNIRRIRMKIEEEPSSPKYIITIWGYGYKWNDMQ